MASCYTTKEWELASLANIPTTQFMIQHITESHHPYLMRRNEGTDKEKLCLQRLETCNATETNGVYHSFLDPTLRSSSWPLETSYLCWTLAASCNSIYWHLLPSSSPFLRGEYYLHPLWFQPGVKKVKKLRHAAYLGKRKKFLSGPT